MGRHRKKATRSGVDKIRKQEHVDEPVEAVEDRLGLTKQVCSNCDARNAKRADRCRRCGSTHLRAKAAQFRDE